MRAVLLPGDKRCESSTGPFRAHGHTRSWCRTAASAICRSDMSIYYGNPIVGGQVAADAALIVPGHEAAGVVVEVDRRCTSVSVGDRVAGYLADR